MLRSLDPHSNYYDREEFDELKTDQRSEYFGIGASIQNYVYGDQADTYITATFDGSPAQQSRTALWRSHCRSRRRKDDAASRRWKCATRFVARVARP